MELILLTFIIITISILIVVVAMLIRTIGKLNTLEEAGLRDVELTMKRQTDMALPGDMQVRFEDILQKHEAYLDELLRTTTNSFDRKIHKTLDTSIQNQLQAYQKVIDTQQSKMLEEMEQLNQSITNRKLSIGDDAKKLELEMRNQYQRRLEHHFAEIAWQFISETLSESVDLHSQKDAIFKHLQDSQKQIKKDFSDADKITK